MASALPRVTGLLYSQVWGNHHHAITTESKEAQQYFDQGLILLYAFNHAEAIRSFEEAARRDPKSAMAEWGAAFAHGPNINAPMMGDALEQARAALQRAQNKLAHASPKERAYIEALAKRYPDHDVEDRKPYDLAFADAMRSVAEQYPDDLDAQTLFAEALMDTMPWDYWLPDGRPKPETQEVLTVLESVINRDPNHPGANHYYIHAVEASPNPEKGLGAAYRLKELCPGAGHLVHMPAHIFLRMGDYSAASEANVRAIAADESYITQCKAQGFYPANYYSHNVHFLWFSRSMEGRSADGIAAGKKSAAAIPDDVLGEMVHLQWIKAVPLHAFVRFGRWDEILSEPQPAANADYQTGMWHYARGLAYLRRGDLDKARSELAALTKIADSEAIAKLDLPTFPGKALTDIARTILHAEVAGAEGKSAEWISGLEEAVAKEDALAYMEPPYWYFQIRHFLGAALLESGNPGRAEEVYLEDLKRRPNNGWALFGLLQAQRAQGKSAAALATEAQFREAWQDADVVLTSSRY
jgi:tetratricopeptide (TPR) repeat protein